MSKTINAKRTIYASMRTERLVLRSLMCFLAMVAICGFIVMPIAGAELDAAYDSCVCVDDAMVYGETISLDHTITDSGDEEDVYLQGIRYAVIDLGNEIEECRCIDEALHAFNIRGASADTKLRGVISFCDKHGIQSRFHIGTDDNIYCWMTLYYPSEHRVEHHDHLLNEAEKAQACSMIMDELKAKGLRYHPLEPTPKQFPDYLLLPDYLDHPDLPVPFEYQAEIGNVTFHFIIENQFLENQFLADLYLWLTPEIKERQDNREQNMVFKFEANTKDLVVYYPKTLEDDILYQNSMMLNLDGCSLQKPGPGLRPLRPELEQALWLDKEYDTSGHRHTLDIGQDHTITVSCWIWHCTCPDGSTFEEHSWDFKKK